MRPRGFGRGSFKRIAGVCQGKRGDQSVFGGGLPPVFQQPVLEDKFLKAPEHVRRCHHRFHNFAAVLFIKSGIDDGLEVEVGDCFAGCGFAAAFAFVHETCPA